MMARQPTPDGRRVHMNVKFSEAEAALVDAVRGDLTRSEWLRRSALASVRRTKRAVAAQLAVEPYTPEELAALNARIAAEDATEAP